MFRGVCILNLDTKGRLAVPAKYRERLQTSCDAQLVVTVDRDRCLLLYPAPEWELIERQLAALPAFDKSARAIQRLYIGNAQEVEMDAEIWDEATWHARTEAALGDEAIGELALGAGLGSLTL